MVTSCFDFLEIEQIPNESLLDPSFGYSTRVVSAAKPDAGFITTCYGCWRYLKVEPFTPSILAVFHIYKISNNK